MEAILVSRPALASAVDDPSVGSAGYRVDQQPRPPEICNALHTPHQRAVQALGWRRATEVDPGTILGLARFASRMIPPGADTSHSFVIAVHHLNGSATCADIWPG